MKKTLLIIAVGLGVGYILGARAGRERYDQIVDAATGFWEDPRVVKTRTEAAKYAREQAPVVRDRAQAVAKDVANRTATTAKAVTDRTVTAAKSAADKATVAATKAATRVGEARDNVLDSDSDS
jgi:membrane protein involved in colicin uptake